MGKVITITAQKGGIGKTTVAKTLAAGLKIIGEENGEDTKILLVDVDVQATLSRSFDYDRVITVTLPNLLQQEINSRIDPEVRRQCGIQLTDYKVEDAIYTSNEGIDVLCTIKDGSLFFERQNIESVDDNLSIIDTILCKVKDKYEWIIIDCGPSLDYLQLNVIYAADSVIIPVNDAVASLDAIPDTLHNMVLVRNQRPGKPVLNGILIQNMERVRVSKAIEESVRGYDLFSYDTVIPRTYAAASLADVLRKSIFVTDKKNNKGIRPLATAYMNFCREFIQREKEISENANTESEL